MRSALVRASLLFLVATFAVSTGSGQPPTPRMPEPRPLPRPNPWIDPYAPNPKQDCQPDKKEPPPPTDPPEVLIVTKQPLRIPPVPPEWSGGPKVLDTAFPDLKPPTRESKPGPNGISIVEEKGVVPLPPFPVVGADAPPLRKVQYEQMREGFEYIYRVRRMHEIGGIGREYRDFIAVTAEAYRLAAELEEVPAKRVPWYEARVRTFKDIEEYTARRVNIGTEHSSSLNLARLERLKAEVDLLKLKAEIEKAKK